MGQRKRSKQQATILSAAGLVQTPLQRSAALRTSIRGAPRRGPLRGLLRAGNLLPCPWSRRPPLPALLQSLLLLVGTDGGRRRASPLPAAAASATAEPIPPAPVPKQIRASSSFVYFFFSSFLSAAASTSTTKAATGSAGAAEAGPAHCHQTSQLLRSSHRHRRHRRPRLHRDDNSHVCSRRAYGCSLWQVRRQPQGDSAHVTGERRRF